MKIESVSYHDKHDTFAASFDDGITIIMSSSLQYSNMISCGLDSIFLKKGKWPTANNIDKRITLAKQWIMKNKNRYKKLRVSGDQPIIDE